VGLGLSVNLVHGDANAMRSVCVSVFGVLGRKAYDFVHITFVLILSVDNVLTLQRIRINEVNCELWWVGKNRCLVQCTQIVLIES
jgi:hypothetical protein